MTLNISDVFKTVIKTTGEQLQDDGKAIGEGLAKVFEANKTSFAELAEARKDGEITQEIFDEELERMKKIVEVEMLSLKIASDSAVKKAVRGAISALSGAVSTLV